MKIKQTVTLTTEEAVKILSKVIENKTKKKVTKSEYATLSFVLEDLDLDAEQPATAATTPTK
jgi:hypothetical protein